MQTGSGNDNGNLCQPMQQDIINWATRVRREIPEEVVIKSLFCYRMRADEGLLFDDQDGDEEIEFEGF